MSPSQVALVLKKLPVNSGDARDTGFNAWVGKTALKEEMAVHSSFLTWKIPRTEKPGEKIVNTTEDALHNSGEQREGEL